MVPALARQHDDLILDRVVFFAQADERLCQYLIFLVLPVLVLLAQAGGQLLRPHRVVRQKQLGSKLGPSHAPRGIDARREHKADGGRGQALVLHARLAQQHLQTDIAGRSHLLESFGHDDTVFAHDRHDIRHRAQRDQVGIAVEHCVRVALERANQLERHAHARQTVKRIRAVRPLVVHDRVRLRQGVVALVVVGDDHLHTQLARDRDLLVRRDAGVHRDEQARAPLI